MALLQSFVQYCSDGLTLFVAGNVAGALSSCW